MRLASILLVDDEVPFVETMTKRLNQRGFGVLSAHTGQEALDRLSANRDIDVVILNSRREPTVLRNDSPRGNHWLQIRLQGTTTNRDGVGSFVRVTAGDLVQVDEVHSGRGYQGHHGMRLHFGLGKRDHVDSVEVRWLGGKVERFNELPIDRLVTLVQGTGQSL